MTRSAPWKHRLALGLVVVGSIVLGLKLLPDWPVRQRVVLRFEAPATVRSIAATWTRENEQTPRRGTRSSFADGAPAQLERELSLPNGDYVLRVNVQRRVGGALVETSHEHRVKLEGRNVIVFVAAPSSS